MIYKIVLFSFPCLAATSVNGKFWCIFLCRCYECGEFGHLSYACPNNLLGEREPPKKKSKRRKKEAESKTKKICKSGDTDEEADEEENFEDESLSAAIRYQVGLCLIF